MNVPNQEPLHVNLEDGGSHYWLGQDVVVLGNRPYLEHVLKNCGLKPSARVYGWYCTCNSLVNLEGRTVKQTLKWLGW